jgi:predicted alpha/beta hydrolase family esterase
MAVNKVFMEKKQVFYIHGGESFLNHDDFIKRLEKVPLWHMQQKNAEVTKKWTSSFLEDLGDKYEVIMPPMPNRQNARFEEWSIWFERHFEYLNEGFILMGCSLGAMFLAKYLTLKKLPISPKALFLMAGAYELPGFSDKDCGDFLIKPEEVSIEQIEKIVILHSKDDFLVPFEHGEALSAALPQAEFVVFDDKNHFLISEFPELISKIKSF